ncbi:AEC family transporter [Roseinatronobacter alkalisoli]|uniref:AEC family transporter n=1 Tax=Roseinatronobacter alkalisoli TaxID=3028235 RepID=A0ABT5T6D4_9RHOB|nr:AEC family transporter [Roseinatronobacter sp. HJB301]MDD7970679.1 AEC family transporter [Roseinatronobacter sp. HJB301]
MQALANVILPVFLIIGFGYIARWRQLITDSHVDGVVLFTQNFAIPCLLFVAIARLDLGQDFDLRLLASFYAGAIICFGLGFGGARLLFKRDWEDCVVIGFVALFSNSLLLGLPITERAYGSDALAANFAIIAVHSPICYGIGITAMELVRNRGGRLRDTGLRVLKAMFRNALVIGIALGFIVNFSGLPIPGVMDQALDMMVRAALPAALFGLGGVLYRYRPEGDLRTIGFVVTLSLVVHPAITFGLAHLLGVGTQGMRSAVVTAAMAPGVNAYVFANLYGRAKRVAASAVLIGTAGVIVTGWVWLQILP